MKVVSTLLVLAGLAVSSVAMANHWGDDGWNRRRNVGWVYVKVDRNGCRSCAHRIYESYPNSCYSDVWRQAGYLCRDRRDFGRVLACRQYGTNNNDELYRCQ